MTDETDVPRVHATSQRTRSGPRSGEEVQWLTGTELAGTPVELAIDDAGRPVALRLQRGGKIGTLLIHWSDWQRIGGVRIPMSVQIDQGKDIFRFRFRRPRLEPPGDALGSRRATLH